MTNKIFNKTFSGCTGGDVYATTFEPGDEVPTDLEDAAIATESIETDDKKAAALFKARQAELSGDEAPAADKTPAKKAADNSKKTPVAKKKAADNSKK